MVNSSKQDEVFEGRRLWAKPRGLFSVTDISTSASSKIELGKIFIDAYRNIILSESFDCTIPVCLRPPTNNNNSSVMARYADGVYRFNGCFPVQIDVNKFENMFVTLSCDSTQKIDFSDEEIFVLNKLERNISQGWSKEAIISALTINGISIKWSKIIAGPELKKMLEEF